MGASRRQFLSLDVKVVDQCLQNGLYELSEALEIIKVTAEEIKAAIECKGGRYDI